MLPPIDISAHHTQSSYNLYEEIEQASSIGDVLSCSSDLDLSFLDSEDDSLIASEASLDISSLISLDQIVSVMH